MVERIDRSKSELDVPLRVDMIKDFERHVGEILHINIFVNDNDAFRERSLSERPDRVHYLTRLAWVRLLDRNDHQVVENALNGQVYVDQFRDGELHHRQEYPLDRFAHVGVFLRRLAHDSRRINRIFAMRDAGDVEHGVKVFKRVEACVIAEWAFRTQFIEVDVSLKNNLTRCRYLEIDRFALD